jgi:hypothetical protein
LKKNEIPEELKVASIWTLWTFFSVGVIGWALFVLLEAFGVLKDGAAWVQAVGSIAAIWGAFSISNRQVRKEEELRNLENRNKARARLGVVKNVATYAEALNSFVENEPSPSSFSEVWSSTMSFTTGAAIESLRCLPAHDLGSDIQVLLYNEMLGAFAQLRNLAAKLADNKEHHPMTTLDAYRDIQIQANSIKALWLDFLVHFNKNPY